MRYGLSEQTIEKICGVLANHPAIDKAVLYGSRAKGNFRPGSDIDLSLYGAGLSSKEMSEIGSELDDLLLPYSIDLLIFDDLDHAKLREHIERVGVVFYQCSRAAESKGADEKRGWEIKKLGDICDFQGGSQPPKSEFIYEEKPGYVRFLQIRDFGSDKNITYIRHSKKNRLCGENDILIGRYGASVGKILTGKAGAYNVALMKTIPNLDVLDRSWFYNYLLSDEFQYQLLNVADRSAQAGFSKDDIYNFPVPVPPLPEQQRIVTILDQAFDSIATAKANAEKNLQNARALFESHLQSVFTQRGEGWVDRQLASLCHEITVGHVGSMKTEYKESGVPFLRSQNIRPFVVSMENAMFIDEKFHRALKKSQLRPGDLAIVRTGYPGTAAVIPPELPDSNCSDLVIVRPSKEVNPHFLAAFFNSAFGKQLVLGKIVGAAQKHFNITAAKEVMLHVPPMQEQRAIIGMVDNFREETQRLESIYQQKIAALDALKKSLLDQAFTGQL